MSTTGTSTQLKAAQRTTSPAGSAGGRAAAQSGSVFTDRLVRTDSAADDTPGGR